MMMMSPREEDPLKVTHDTEATLLSANDGEHDNENMQSRQTKRTTKSSSSTVVIGALFIVAFFTAALLLYISFPLDHFGSSNLSAQLLKSSSGLQDNTHDHDESAANNLQLLAAQALKQLNDHVVKAPDQPECKVTVLITRHCNDYGVYAKDDAETGDKHCSFVGYERTRFFAQHFESPSSRQLDQDAATPIHNDPPARWPTPSALYALLPAQAPETIGINYRQIETLLPLAKRTNVTIQIVGTPNGVAQSIHKRLQQNNEYGNEEEEASSVCGQVMVVAWKHAFIPDVAAALGCSKDQGCYDYYPDEEFDLVWQLRFVYEPPAPEDEVLRLFDQESLLLQDDQQLLVQQQKWQEAHRRKKKTISGKQTNDAYQHKSVRPGWTVYGGVTNQNFDPLSNEYHHAKWSRSSA